MTMNILVVDDRDPGRGRAMAMAFCRDDRAAHLATSRTDVHLAPDWERGTGLPDRIDLLILHHQSTEQEIAESLLEGRDVPATIRYSGSGRLSHDDRWTIKRPIDSAGTVLTPDEANELCDWIGHGAPDGQTPSFLRPFEWPASLVGVYFGLIANSRGVDVLGDLRESWSIAETELQQLLTQRSDCDAIQWDGFDLETPESSWNS